jgi:uroporphyrinogen III methyltransferase/synthase
VDDEVVLYDTVSERPDPAVVERALGGDWITFTSSSTVRNLMGLLDDDGRERVRALRVASIGPVTSRTAREAGLEVEVEAAEHTIPGLLAALLGAR